MLDIILHIAHLVKSLEQFLGLFFLCNGGGGCDDFLGEHLLSQPIDMPTLLYLHFLSMEPAIGSFFQPCTSNRNPLVWSAQRQL